MISRQDVLELYAGEADIFSIHVEILARLEIDEADVALYEWTNEEGAA